jgi:hypothetical protein
MAPGISAKYLKVFAFLFASPSGGFVSIGFGSKIMIVLNGLNGKAYST